MKVLSFGEILFDITEEKKYIGGAPFNVAAHLSKLGAQSYILTGVGSDKNGQEALESTHDLGIKTDFISTTEKFPTGTVTVELKDGKPSYTIHENTAWDNISLCDSELDRLTSEPWDLLAYGTLAQRTKENRNLLDLIRTRGHFKAIFYDVNLRQHFFKPVWILSSFEDSSIVKINDEEAVFLSKLLYNREMKEEEFADIILGEFDLDIVCITFGADGAGIMTEEGWSRIPGEKIRVRDTVGVGDSFSAEFLHSLYSGYTPVEAAGRACVMGAYVASSTGAVPGYSDELKEILSIG